MCRTALETVRTSLKILGSYSDKVGKIFFLKQKWMQLQLHRVTDFGVTSHVALLSSHSAEVCDVVLVHRLVP